MKSKSVCIKGTSESQKSIETCCLGCVFSEGRFVQKEKQLQFFQSSFGCKMKVLEKYKKQGEEIQDAIDESNSEFHVIHGRLCPYHRTPDWPGWRQAGEDDKTNDIDAAMIMAREEVTLKPEVVIYYDGKNDPSTILATADALSKGEIVPTRLYIVNNSEIRASQLIKVLEDCTIPWRIETIMEPGCTVERSFDIITKKCGAIFVTYFEAGCLPPEDFFKSIDVALYDDLDKFVCLEPIPGTINGLTVLRIFYKQADGNARSPIWEKAKKISEEQKCQYLVRPVTEIVTQLSQ